MSGSVLNIFIAPADGADIQTVDAVNAIVGRGLEGDRYTLPSDKPHKPKQEVTLIQLENIDLLNQTLGADIEPYELRRNILTRGIDLNALVGKEFQVGAVRLRGMELCEPCSYIEGRTAKGVIKHLTHKAGIRAQILEGGPINIGDEISE